MSESSAPEQGPEAVSIAGNPPVNSDKAIEAGQSDAFAAGPARSRAQRKVPTRRRPRPPGWKPRLRQRLPAPPRRRSPPTSPAVAVRESTIMGVLVAVSRPSRRVRPAAPTAPAPSGRRLCSPSLPM